MNVSNKNLKNTKLGEANVPPGPYSVSKSSHKKTWRGKEIPLDSHFT